MVKSVMKVQICTYYFYLQRAHTEILQDLTKAKVNVDA